MIVDLLQYLKANSVYMKAQLEGENFKVNKRAIRQVNAWFKVKTWIVLAAYIVLVLMILSEIFHWSF